MKKIAIINAVPYGSTGKIVKGIADVCHKTDREVWIYYSWTKKLRKGTQNIQVGSFVGKFIHMCLSRITGYNGCFGILDTLKFVYELKKFNPDIINLHILHSWCVNLPILFKYIKKNNCHVIWTLHDCWAFTGQCPHFTMVKCNKWVEGCFSCPQYRNYPSSYVDRTKKMWKLKKKWFTGISNMAIIAPSEWMADVIKKSFLSSYDVNVIYNGIDLDVFKPTKSDFCNKYNISKEKYIVLGVAFDWGIKKGLDVFIELSKCLDERFKIILVGTNDEIDKKIPESILSIHRTKDQKELAMIYTQADVFVNPTREEVLGMVNIEALACGTPIVAFDTGGCPECFDESCGVAVPCDDLERMKTEIERVCIQKPYSEVDCIRKASEFDMYEKYNEYIQLFERYS